MGNAAVKKRAKESKAKKRGKAETSDLPLASNPDAKTLTATETLGPSHMADSKSDVLNIKVSELLQE